MTKRRFSCRNCGHVAAHGLLQRDGDGTEWYMCQNCKAPFGIPTRKFVEETRKKA